MSPPDTNLEKQGKQHKGPLIGMPAAIAIATIFFIAIIVWMNVYEPRENVEVNVETVTQEAPAEGTEGAVEPDTGATDGAATDSAVTEDAATDGGGDGTEAEPQQQAE